MDHFANEGSLGLVPVAITVSTPILDSSMSVRTRPCACMCVHVCMCAHAHPQTLVCVRASMRTSALPPPQQWLLPLAFNTTHKACIMELGTPKTLFSVVDWVPYSKIVLQMDPLGLFFMTYTETH